MYPQTRAPRAASATPAPPAPAPAAPPSAVSGRKSLIGEWWDKFKAANRGPRAQRYTWAEIKSALGEYWRSPLNILFALLMLPIIGYFIYQASVYWVMVIDDSYITFRFADMFANGLGFRFNVAGDPVEGFTNFLWLIPISLVIRLGGDAMFWAKLMGMAYAIGIIITAYQFSRHLRGRRDIFNLFAPILLATNSHFGHWALAGLETHGAVFFVFFAYYRFYREMHDKRMWLISPWAASCAAMMRIDSLYYMSPLGLYGVILILMGQLPIRRLFAWGTIAALSFGFYFWSKWLYFGDMAPNTYYAKQRDVTSDRTRGLQHLISFYSEQNPDDNWNPAPIKNLVKNAPDHTQRVVERIAFLYKGGRTGMPFWWINWWAVSAGIIILWPRLKTYLLVLTPLAMNVYYVYHVNGDWMPGYRFLQITLPFWALAGPLAISVVQDFTQKFRLVPRLGLRAPVYLFMSAILLGVGIEHTRMYTVYVFGGDPLWAPRGLDWWKWNKVKEAYEGGFSPPLRETADWMLLNTVDGGSIFMSDIGQPLWFCRHLDLYDYDGLTDKYFADAPSVRKGLKPLDAHLTDVLRERNVKNPGKEQTEQAMAEARSRYQATLDKRNAAYIHEQEKPEYLLLFMTFRDVNNPMGEAWPYPKSAPIYNHPGFRQNYEFVYMNSKIGDVKNAYFKRKDVPRVIPDEVKARRVIQTINRNPRMYYLIALAYGAALSMEDEKAKTELMDFINKRVDKVVRNTYAVQEMIGMARQQNDPDMLDKLMALTGKGSANTPDQMRMRAELSWNRGDQEKAITYLRKAVDLSAADDNGHLYHLAYYYEASGQPRKSVEASEEAARRVPKDARAWMDVMGYAGRHGWDSSKPREERIWFLEKSIAGGEGLIKLMPEDQQRINNELERTRRELERLKQNDEEDARDINAGGQAEPAVPQPAAAAVDAATSQTAADAAPEAMMIEADAVSAADAITSATAVEAGDAEAPAEPGPAETSPAEAPQPETSSGQPLE